MDLFCRIPWNMITRSEEVDAQFLLRDSAQPASVTIDASPFPDGKPRHFSVSLPPFPRILLIVPTKLNTEGRPTWGAEHQKELTRSMVGVYAKEGIENRIAIVSTFQEFRQQLRDGINGLAPHIIYFYGHADAWEMNSQFLFDKPGSDAGEWINVDEIHAAVNECLRKIGNFPPVIWINACKGASGNRNSFLRSLAPLASTILTTRTLAAVGDSRAVAEAALPLIVLNGQAPHSALREVLEDKMPPVQSSRWATMIVSVQYDFWSALETESRQVEDVDSAGDFPSRMDRTSTLSSIEAVLTNHFSANADASQSDVSVPLSIGWRGNSDQRIDIFERRVADLLQERLHRWPTVSRRIELQLDTCPAGGDDLKNHFLASVHAGVLSRRTHVGTPAPDLAVAQAVIKRMLTKDTRAVLFEHGPFVNAHLGQILEYMKFWKDYFRFIMPRERKYMLVLAFGFSEEVSAVTNNEIEELPEFVQLGPIAKYELKNHLEIFYHFTNCLLTVPRQRLSS